MFCEILIGLHGETHLENSGLNKVKDFSPAGFLRTLNMLQYTSLQDKAICAAFPKRAVDSFINLTAH